MSNTSFKVAVAFITECSRWVALYYLLSIAVEIFKWAAE